MTTHALHGMHHHPRILTIQHAHINGMQHMHGTHNMHAPPHIYTHHHHPTPHGICGRWLFIYLHPPKSQHTPNAIRIHAREGGSMPSDSGDAYTQLELWVRIAVMGAQCPNVCQTADAHLQLGFSFCCQMYIYIYMSTLHIIWKPRCGPSRGPSGHA